MEKIDTPIIDLIKSERDMLRMANNAIDLSSDEEEKEFFRSEKIKHLYAISMLSQQLDKERQAIEKAYDDGLEAYKEHQGFADSPEKHFENTFNTKQP